MITVSWAYDSDFVFKTILKNKNQIRYLIWFFADRTDSHPSRLSRDRDRAAH